MSVGGKYKLRLLGSFELTDRAGTRIRITSRKGMALIALLALARGGERSRTWLQDRLWGSRSLPQAQASLRRELANLRSAIGGGAAALLKSDMARVRLDLDEIEVDVRALEQGTFVQGLDAGEFLEGFDIAEEGFEDWLREQRSLIEQLIEHARRRAWEMDLLHAADGGADAAEPGAVALSVAANAAPRPTHKPSIAVLSFAHPGGEDWAALAAGLAEGIAISMARSPILFVVHGGSTPPLQGSREGDRARLCRELGVRYLIEGSMQGGDGKVRINVRLVDGLVGEQLWAERFTGDHAALFHFQDTVADTVAHLIDASIDSAERRHAMAVPVQNADAYQLYWRANALFRRWEREPVREAISIAQRILELEPGNSWAASLAAFCHAISLTFGWSDEPETSRSEAERLYELAMRNGGDDPFVLGYAAGTLLGIGGDLEVADGLIGRALSIHADMSAALFWGGWVDIARGEYQRALVRFERALEVNPRSAVRAHSLTGIGICFFASERFEDSATVLRSAAQELPHNPITLAANAAVCAKLGRFEEAGMFAQRLREAGRFEVLSRLLGTPDAGLG
jgi:TolB-like protein